MLFGRKRIDKSDFMKRDQDDATEDAEANVRITGCVTN